MMPARIAAAGLRSAGAVTRLPPASASSTVPASGRCTPVRIFTRVDLPEPFSPMIACTSPARNSAEQERSATVGPKALASPVTRSATGPASRL